MMEIRKMYLISENACKASGRRGSSQRVRSKFLSLKAPNGPSTHFVFSRILAAILELFQKLNGRDLKMKVINHSDCTKLVIIIMTYPSIFQHLKKCLLCH